MQRGKWTAIIAAGALIAFVAWPYVTAYRLKAAVKSGDTAALADLIEFPTLRQGLKEQLNAAMLARLAAEPGGDSGLLAGLGLAALAGTFIDKAVDTYVTPAGVARLVAGDRLELQSGDRSNAAGAATDGPGAEPTREPFADAKMAYESFDRFVVTVPGEAGEANRFVLRRRGLGWKLTDILVPLD